MARLIATWFGCGYIPVAPGTAGSAAAMAIGFLLREYAGWGAAHFALLAVALCWPGVWAAGAVAKRMNKQDPGIVVVDEVIGQWVTLAGISSYNWRSWLAAFLLFRLFDILKPPPIRRLESFPGGAGIVADDILAGVYAALLLYAAGTLNWY